MNINVNDPQFLLTVLKDEVVNRTRYLVSQGIAYDSDWRDAFVELFQVMDQLEIPVGDKLEEYMTQDELEVPTKTPITTADEFVARLHAEIPMKEISLKEHEAILLLKYPLETKVTMGKGATIWTVDDHKGQSIHVSRPGPGMNRTWVNPNKLHILSDQNS